MVSEKKLASAVRELRDGNLVVFPTETAYGLGCDATNASAVQRVYALKGRSGRKPLATIAADLGMVKKFFRLRGPEARLAREYWPGPLSIVLPARDVRLRRALGSRVGVRVSSHPVACTLSRALARPIVATSANRSGRGNCYSMSSVRRKLGTIMLRSMIVSGNLPRRSTSTVVEFVGNRLIIHRAGAIRI